MQVGLSGKPLHTQRMLQVNQDLTLFRHFWPGDKRRFKKKVFSRETGDLQDFERCRAASSALRPPPRNAGDCRGRDFVTIFLMIWEDNASDCRRYNVGARISNLQR